MANLRCPCGNYIWDCSGVHETTYCFLPADVLAEHAEDTAFFSLSYSGFALEMWKCDVCDRMMIFDDPAGPVSCCMRQVEAEAVPSVELDRPHVDGICFSNLFFNEVDAHFEYARCNGESLEYVFFEPAEGEEGLPLLTPKVMQEEIFSHKAGKLLHWWPASLYDEYLILYSPHREHWPKPVRAWKAYLHV